MPLALLLICFGCVGVSCRGTRRSALDGFQVEPGGTPLLGKHDVQCQILRSQERSGLSVTWEQQINFTFHFSFWLNLLVYRKRSDFSITRSYIQEKTPLELGTPGEILSSAPSSMCRQAHIFSLSCFCDRDRVITVFT